MPHAAGNHPIIQNRITQRANAAKTARHLRNFLRGHAPSPAIRRAARKAIQRENPPPKPTINNLNQELAERLADITHAHQNPPTHLPCGEDDAWYERLHAYSQETRELANYLVEVLGLEWGRDPVLSGAQQAVAGADTCPYCLTANTRAASEPEPLSAHALRIRRECRECEKTYDVTYRIAP